MWWMHTMEYHTEVGSNEWYVPTAIWIDFKNAVLTRKN